MQFRKIFFSAALAAGVASAQIAMNGPVEGYVFDAPTGTLRAVMGSPGSATLGPPLADGIDFASPAPHHSYAIAFQAGACQLISNLNAVATSTAVTGSIGQPEGAVWSGDGTEAILYSRTGNWIQTLSGLPGNATAAPSIDISSLGGKLVAVTSDAHGTRIAVAVTGDAGGVYVSSDGQSFNPLLNSSTVVALSFSLDGSALYALDSATGLSSVDLNTFSSQNIALDGLSNPVAIRAAQDGQGRQVIYVASGSDQLLRIVDPVTAQAVTDVTLSVPPALLDPLGDRSYVIASRSALNQPLWLFTDIPTPSGFFVPAIQNGAGGLQ